MRRNKRNYDTQWQSDMSGERSPYQMIKCAADRVATFGGLARVTESRACVLTARKIKDGDSVVLDLEKYFYSQKFPNQLNSKRNGVFSPKLSFLIFVTRENVSILHNALVKNFRDFVRVANGLQFVRTRHELSWI